MKTDSKTTADARPTDDVIPPSREIRLACDLVRKGEADAAVSLLQGPGATTEYVMHWVNYVRGLALFSSGKFEEGMNEFLVPYSTVASDPQAARTADHFRLVGKCLKKIGWLYRRQGAFEQAFAFHSIGYSYYDQYGFCADLHDAADSLDNDAYGMKSLQLSLYWIRMGLEAAKGISDPTARHAAQRMSLNNLAASLGRACPFRRGRGSGQGEP